jgi:hypothetical protein
MKDEKYTPEVGSWLKGREVPPPDSKQTASQVVARLPKVRQRSRWWPLPIIRPATKPSSTEQITDPQITPALATNGHSPTVLGRTQSMFSPVKAITAGALVFAIGGALLVAQPFGQQGSVPGAATDAEPAQTVEVTGQVRFSGSGGSIETWTTDDPRLTGTGKWAPTEGSALQRPPSYFLNGRFLETDDGTWRQLPVPTVNIPGYEGGMTRREGNRVWDMVLVGEGAYEGLVFIAQATWVNRGSDDRDFDVRGFDVRGYIADAARPQPVASTPSE